MCSPPGCRVNCPIPLRCKTKISEGVKREPLLHRESDPFPNSTGAECRCVPVPADSVEEVEKRPSESPSGALQSRLRCPCLRAQLRRAREVFTRFVRVSPQLDPSLELGAWMSSLWPAGLPATRTLIPLPSVAPNSYQIAHRLFLIFSPGANSYRISSPPKGGRTT